MAEDCRMIVDRLRFGNHEIPYDKSKKITFRNALGAVWTIEVFFYRPFGLRLKIPFHFRFRRAWVRLCCEKLRRRVYIEANIQMSSRESTAIRTEGIVKNFIEKGDSSLDLETIFENVEDKIPAIYVSGELKMYVNPENYFYYRYDLGFLPAESQLQATRLQIINELSADLLTALAHQEHTSDVVLRCESEDIRAHKVVLSARSKVFAAMFLHPMTENETNVVDIKDMSPVVLRVLLMYIYSGKATIQNCDNAFEVVIAADRYDLQGLKKLSLYYLQSILSARNALDILTFAEIYDRSLKKKTLDFICMEFDDLKKTRKWSTFQEEKPILANEVLLNIIEFVNADRSNADRSSSCVICRA